MPKFAKSTVPESTGESGVKPLDPALMSESELRAYISKLEKALSVAPIPTAGVPETEWLDGEKRWVTVPRTLTNNIITICGKPYIGRMLVTRETWLSLQEIHNRATLSELSRMQARGNLVAPHLLPAEDISSRTQPITIANLE